MSDELIRLPDAMEPVTRPGIIHHRCEHPGCAKNAGWGFANVLCSRSKYPRS